MIDALHISESGLKANQQWLEHVSNNLANLHTPGYKKTTVNFVDMVRVENSPFPTANSTGQTSTGLGASLSNPRVELESGSVKSTGRPLDVAIRGNGLLEVILPDGTMGYTRSGSLQVNAEGYLTTQSGFVLSSQIEIPYDLSELIIHSNGVVEGVFTGDEANLQLGEILLAQPVDSGSLTPIGNSIFTVPEDYTGLVLSTPGQEGAGEIVQGFLEMSNVSLIDEMSNIVLAQRAYQLNARMIQTADQLLETINNLRR